MNSKINISLFNLLCLMMAPAVMLLIGINHEKIQKAVFSEAPEISGSYYSHSYTPHHSPSAIPMVRELTEEEVEEIEEAIKSRYEFEESFKKANKKALEGEAKPGYYRY